MHDMNQGASVKEVVDARSAIYGDPVTSFVRVAQVWSGILGHEVQPVEVPLLLMGLKMVRTQETPDYSDNTDDIEGYLTIARKIVGDDMVHASSVARYVELKHLKGGRDE